ncbi:MAG: hypothetical protein IKR39_05370 [Lachnospiraceae bacterium]|nr:hypothetical protein [Lachnospiraceae bacterium]
MNAGENEALEVSETLFIKSLATLYEVFMYMMDINLYDYACGKHSAKEIVTKNHSFIEKLLKLRKIN